MNKICTTIEQSKKLIELGIDINTADMHYVLIDSDQETYSPGLGKYYGVLPSIPCWSLAALLNVLPSSTLDSSDNHRYRFRCMERYTEWYDNAIDACVAMIEKLHELKIL